FAIFGLCVSVYVKCKCACICPLGYSVFLPLFSFLFTHQYKRGINSGAKSKVVVNPPMITVANGRCTSEPIPLDRAAGTRPNMASKITISRTLNCSVEECKTASYKGSFFFKFK